MGATSRTKGQAGEREIAALIRDLTGWDVRRRVRQHDGDSDLMGVPGWSIEVKRHARALRSDIAAWWQQAVEQAAPGEKPALFFRANYDSWRAVWSLGVHLGGDWAEYAMTIEGTVEAWAAVAREAIAQAPELARCGAFRACVRPADDIEADALAIVDVASQFAVAPTVIDELRRPGRDATAMPKQCPRFQPAR